MAFQCMHWMQILGLLKKEQVICLSVSSRHGDVCLKHPKGSENRCLKPSHSPAKSWCPSRMSLYGLTCLKNRVMRIPATDRFLAKSLQIAY